MSSGPIDFANIGVGTVKRAMQLDGTSWVKCYECATVEAALALKEHFNAQARQLRSADRVALTNTRQRAFVPLRVATRPVVRDQRKTQQGGPAPLPDPWALQTERGEDQVVRTSTERTEPARWDVGSPERLWWLRGLAAGLDALHRSNWVHGDVKPANVCLLRLTGEPHPTAVLIDFESVSSIDALSGIASRAYWSPAATARVGAITASDAIANDRMGFVAITAAAVFGSAVEQQLFDGGITTSAQKAAAIAHLSRRLPAASKTVAGRFIELFDGNAAAVGVRSCVEWLELLLENCPADVALSDRLSPPTERVRVQLVKTTGKDFESRFAPIVLRELVWPFLTGFAAVVAPVLILIIIVASLGVFR